MSFFCIKQSTFLCIIGNRRHWMFSIFLSGSTLPLSRSRRLTFCLNGLPYYPPASGWIQPKGGTGRRQERGRKVSSRCRFLQLPVCWVTTGDLSQRPQLRPVCPLLRNSHSPQGLVNPLSGLARVKSPHCCQPQDVSPPLAVFLNPEQMVP